jgi:ornithine cyclodeaminase/alanine dehydrogenase-like protein (mu-crystallin family)
MVCQHSRLFLAKSDELNGYATSTRLGRKPGRVSDDEITVCKAMRVAMEDMIAANLAYQRAKREGGGGVMDW